MEVENMQQAIVAEVENTEETVVDSAAAEDDFRFDAVLETGVLEASASPELTRFCSGCR
jgi:hypothetical protein